MAPPTRETDADDQPLTKAERYGWLSWKPDCVQWMNGVSWFMVYVCIACFTQTMCVNGLIGVSLSTIETRYDLQSSQVSWIPSIYEFTAIPVLIVLGLIANSINRARWLGGSLACISFASLLFAMPQFLSDIYQYDSQVAEGRDEWCVINATNLTDVCAGEEEVSSSSYLGFFYAAAALYSIGANPMYLLTVSYIDDSVHYTRGAFYIGIFYSMASLGPALAYMAGGALLGVYVDVLRVDMDEVTITPGDPRWVGAWWIGFLVGCVMAAIVVIPLLGFPAMPPYKRRDPEVIKDRNEVKAVEGTDAKDGTLVDDVTAAQLSLRQSFKNLPTNLKQIVTNAVFLCTVVSALGDGLIIAGFAAFGPKYLEQQFSLSAGVAGALFGIVVLPGAVLGTIFGGWIIKYFRMKPAQMLLTAFLANVVVVGFVFIFFIDCSTAPFAGVTTDSGQASIVSGCNQACNCSTEFYDPMCGNDGVIYFSSCHAGCLNGDSDEGVYGNCTCVGDYYNGTVSSGVCAAPDCWMMWIFLVLFAVPMFILFAGLQCHMQIVLRIVTMEQRPIALTIDWLMGRALGTVPGPIIFGAVLDKSCILWDVNCGDTGSCLYYDNKQMALMMLAVCLGCKGTSTIFSFIAFIIYKHKHPHSVIDKQTIDDIDVKVPPQSLSEPYVSHVSLPTNGVSPNGTSKEPITYQNYASTSDTNDIVQVTSM